MKIQDEPTNGDAKNSKRLQEIKKILKNIEIPKIFIIGAGFSSPAGLPLTQQLFEQIREETRFNTWMSETIEIEYESFKEYINNTYDKEDAERKLSNIEDFISFLDVEHFLSLHGADTWSDIGNQAQILTRNLICKILYNAMKKITPEKFKLYLKFVEKLKPGDIIITFNYDTIIEEALFRLNKRFRFHYYGSFPDGYDENKDIILFKMHGSMNWFNISNFDNFNLKMRHNYAYVQPRNIIFNDKKDIFPPTKAFKYSYQNSPLYNIYQIGKIDEYLRLTDNATICPVIISPSYTKVVYLNPLKDLWFDFYNMGVITETLAIIGFSLPPHDDYLRIPIYHIVHNFQQIKYDDFKDKTNLKIVDLKRNKQEIEQFKKTYSFVDWENTDVYFDGFNEEAIDMIFEAR